MFTLLSIAAIVYVWTRPSESTGFFTKSALTLLIFSGGCCVGVCAGTL